MNLYSIEIATLFATLAGTVGTGLGGLLGAILKKPTHVQIKRLTTFAGGLMLAVSCFDLLPEAYKIDAVWAWAGLVTGALGMLTMELIVDRATKLSPMKTGIMIAIGIMLHNLPEGMAVGSGYAQSESFGWVLCIAITLHDLPEGFAVVSPLIGGGMNRAVAVLITIASGLPTGVGGLIGALMGNGSYTLIALSLGFAAGAMLYVVCGEILPQAYTLGNKKTALILIFGIMLGSVLQLVT